MNIEDEMKGGRLEKMEKKVRLDITKFCLMVILLVFMILIIFAMENLTAREDLNIVETEANYSSKDNEIRAINLRIDFLRNLLNSSDEEILYDSMRGVCISRKLIEKELYLLKQIINP